MKINIEVESIKIPANVSSTDTKHYDKKGIYLVNRDTCFELVWFDGSICWCIPVTSESYLDSIIEVYKDKGRKIKEDTERNVIKHYEQVMKKQEDILAAITTLVNDKTKQQNGNLNLQELTNMIAVSQKPELLKDINNG